MEILGGLGDPAAGKRTDYKIENAYDGSAEACYIPGTNKNSRASFQIPSTLVTYVRILNRRDCCG